MCLTLINTLLLYQTTFQIADKFQNTQCMGVQFMKSIAITISTPALLGLVCSQLLLYPTVSVVKLNLMLKVANLLT